MHCGVLALQGDWEAHASVLDRIGVNAAPVRTAAELADVEALVLPGGESTAMLKLMEAESLGDVIRRRVAAGMPVLATCAGVILLARAAVPEQPCLGLLDVDVERNAYGRQVHSAVSPIDLVAELGPPSMVAGVFIRAPRISRVGPAVRVMGHFRGDPVLVRQGRIVAATFHPELTRDDRIHRLLFKEEEHDDP